MCVDVRHTHQIYSSSCPHLSSSSYAFPRRLHVWPPFDPRRPRRRRRRVVVVAAVLQKGNNETEFMRHFTWRNGAEGVEEVGSPYAKAMAWREKTAVDAQ